MTKIKKLKESEGYTSGSRSKGGLAHPSTGICDLASALASDLRWHRWHVVQHVRRSQHSIKKTY